MAEGKGIDWKSVTFVMGQRADLTQAHWRKNAYSRDCQRCGEKTYTEIEYPLDVPLLCNVCASEVTAQAEQEESNLLLYDFPNEVKARLIDIAMENRVPVEEVYQDFVEWKMGRPARIHFAGKLRK